MTPVPWNALRAQRLILLTFSTYFHLYCLLYIVFLHLFIFIGIKSLVWSRNELGLMPF